MFSELDFLYPILFDALLFFTIFFLRLILRPLLLLLLRLITRLHVPAHVRLLRVVVGGTVAATGGLFLFYQLLNLPHLALLHLPPEVLGLRVVGHYEVVQAVLFILLRVVLVFVRAVVVYLVSVPFLPERRQFLYCVLGSWRCR